MANTERIAGQLRRIADELTAVDRRTVKYTREEETFASLFKKFRTDRGLSQADLSRASEVSPIIISKIERGLRTPNLNSFYRLSICMDLTPQMTVDLLSLAPTRQAGVQRREVDSL